MVLSPIETCVIHTVTASGLPCMVVVSHIDKLCAHVAKDPKTVYFSQDIYFAGLFNFRYFYIVIYHVIFATMGVINQSSWIENRPGAIKPTRNVIMNIKILSQYLSKQRKQIDQKKVAMIY